MATDTPLADAKIPGRNWMISGSRIWTIAAGTLTQLIRMKTFYFLFGLAMLIAIIGNIDIQVSAVEQLELVKKVAFGTMDIFSWLFAIVATAVLIPRDLEDRTLYTILSKPVLRIEYLLGKLIGVLLVILISLVIVFVVFALVLHFRTEMFAHAEVQYLPAGQIPSEVVQYRVELIRAQGLQPEMLVAIYVIFMKAAVVASVTIFMSTFASSSLFSIITSTVLFLVGHAREMMTNFWQQESGGNLVVTFGSKLFKLFIPDYELFSFSEGIILGEKIVPHLVWSMTGISAFYLVFFIALSLLVFYDKEF